MVFVNYLIKHPRLTLLGVWGVSLGIKIGAWNLEPVAGRDAALYLHMVQAWYETGIPPSGWVPPVLFCLMRGLMALGAGAEMAGLIVNIGLGSLLTVVAWGIAYETTRNKKIALAAACFAALHPAFTALSIEIQRDTPYLFFAGSSLWLAFAALQRKKWHLWCGSGLWLAVACLTRFEAFELIPLYGIAIFFFAFRHRLSWKQAATGACTLSLSFLLFLSGFFYFYDHGKLAQKYLQYFEGKYKTVEKKQLTDVSDREAK